MLRTATHRTIAAGALALALAAPSTALGQDDLRGADAKDSDLRSAGSQVQPSREGLDRPGIRQDEAPVMQTAAVSTERGGQGTFEWDAAGIGAAGMLGVVLAIGGGAAAFSHRRREVAATTTR